MSAKGVPRGRGSSRSDDINGDDYPDAVIISAGTKGVRFLTVLYGGRDGLVPERRTVVETGDQQLPGLGWRARQPDTADLDGDGFADIPVLLHGRGTPALRILWGGPGGPQKVGLSPAVPVPEAEWPALGDFDGDGHADLALAVPTRNRPALAGYVVLYGPFGRNGRPSRTFTGPSPRIGSYGRYPGWVVADPIRPGRRSGLILHAGNDDEQSDAVDMPQVPSTRVHRLGPGNGITIGDFDGDGRRDVAVGDTGTRNDEPGYEKLGATDAVTVHYGRAPDVPVRIRVPGIRGNTVAGDVDGDGRDDLMLQADGRIQLRTKGLSATRTLGPFSCPTDKSQRVVTAGDYDRDGRAEVLLNCGDYPPGVRRWWIWDANRPVLRFDTSTFTA